MVRHAVKAIREQALPWLHDMSDLRRALETFESRPESEMRPGIMHEILGGGLSSLARAEMISALALACDQRERARAAWERMLSNPYYKGPGEMRTLAEERIRLI